MTNNKTNKVLIALVIVLVAAVVAFGIWFLSGKKFFEGSYHAVYLETGDVYFGKLTHFPRFGLKNVYLIQTNPQNPENPISLQRFSEVFWGPEDRLYINRNKVVWTAKLKGDGELAKLLKTNPDFTKQTGRNLPQEQAESEKQGSEIPENKSKGGGNSE